MELLEGLNAALDYIESHLADEIDMERAARHAAHRADGFSRLFRQLTGMTANEYIRRRRLTKAAYDLRKEGARVIDAALKYGYESADAFCRAFARQHGITPTEAKNPHNPLKAFPPISFYIKFTGARDMDFRIIETQGLALKGIRKRFSGGAAGRFAQAHTMWADHHDDVPAMVSAAVPGKWYGIWDGGTYAIARDSADTIDGDLEEITVNGGTYAAFRTGFGGFAGDELPKLRELIFDAWLKDSGYRQTKDYEVEVYHLYPKGEKHQRHYEIWVPVEKG